MTSKHTAGAILALVSIGLLAAALWWRSQPSASRPPERTVEERAPLEVSELEAAPAAEATSDSQEPPPTSSTALAPDESPRDPEAGSALLPRPPAARLSGTLVDDRGQPIKGGRVLCARGARDEQREREETQRMGPARESGTAPPIPAWAWSLDCEMLAANDDVVEATCDEEGRFEVSLPRAGAWRLALRAAGHVPRDVDSLWLPVESQLDLGRLALVPSLVLAGIVVDSDGAPVADAELFARDDLLRGSAERLEAVQGRRVARTDEFGEFRIDQLRSGAWTLRVVSEMHPECRIEGHTRLEESPLAPMRIQLARGCEISGWVRTQRPATIIVHALPAELARFDGEPESRLPSSWSPRARSAQVELDGAFRLQGLECGERYALRVLSGADPDAPDVWTASAWVVAGQMDVQLQDIEDMTLAFQAVDRGDGLPIESFVARFEGAQPRALRSSDGSIAARHEQGRVRWSGVRPERGTFADVGAGEPADGGPFTLRIEAEGYDDKSVEGLFGFPGQFLDLGRVALEPMPSVRVVVVEAVSGSALAGCMVRLLPDGADLPPGSRRESRATTDAGGRARLTGLRSVRSLLSVEHPGFAPHTRLVAGVMDPDEPAFVVELGPGGGVDLSVVDERGEPVRDALVQRVFRGASLPGFAASGALWRAEVVLDEHGRARLAALEPGVHGFVALPAPAIGELRAPAVGNLDAWTHVSVATGASQPLELTVARCVDLTGEVWVGKRPLSDARLRLVPGVWGFRAELEPESGWERTLRARANAIGRFEFERLLPGSYTLQIESDELELATRRVVELERDGEPLFIDVEDTGLRGSVRGPDGEPAVGAEVLVWASPLDDRAVDGLTRLEQLPWTHTLARADADASGEFSVLGLPSGVRCDVWARWRGSSGALIQLELEQAEIREGFELQLLREAQLDVEVLDYEGGEPLAVVAFQRETLVANVLRLDGVAGRLAGMTPGAWFVQAFAIGEGGRLARVGAARFVELGEGAAVRVSLESGG